MGKTDAALIRPADPKRQPLPVERQALAALDQMRRTDPPDNQNKYRRTGRVSLWNGHGH